jgi:putative transposase
LADYASLIRPTKKGMPQYRRARVPGGTFFFTVNLADRSRSLLVDRIEELRAAVRAVRLAHPFAIDAMVVMPDHLHSIWTLPPSDADFSMRWRLIKTRFQWMAGEHGIWQKRFWEHQIRSERDFEAHADYIHFNPVKHGHAAAPGEWPYSTFARFVAAGRYEADWAAGDRVRAMERE